MTEKRKGTPRNTRLYASLAGLVLVMIIAVLALNFNDPVPEALKDLTQTQDTLYLTATYYGQFARPHPSMTYHGDCYLGSATACAADRAREFDSELERFQRYAATGVVRTLTAAAQITTTP